MLDRFPVQLAVGTLLGFLSGLGIGGGSLLVLWLTLVLDVPAETARSINLLFFLPAALVSCGFRIRQGSLCVRKVLPAVISGCLAATLLSLPGTIQDTTVLKKAFGVLLLITGIREILYRPKETPQE